MTSSCVFEEIMAHVKNWKKMAFPERLRWAESIRAFTVNTPTPSEDLPPVFDSKGENMPVHPHACGEHLDTLVYCDIRSRFIPTPVGNTSDCGEGT